MRQGAHGWCTGMTQRDGMGREVEGGFRMGSTSSKGEWKELDCEHNQVPEGIIPAPIRKYVSENQKGQRIVEIKKERRHYDVKLSNKLEMEFSLDGKLLRFD